MEADVMMDFEFDSNHVDSRYFVVIVLWGIMIDHTHVLTRPALLIDIYI